MLDDAATLHNLLNFMQEMQSDKTGKNDLAKRRLALLEERRRELFENITSSSPDNESRRKLEETEHQLEQTRKTLLESEDELRVTLTELRQRILKMTNDELAQLETENREIRLRKEEIQHGLLPEIRERLTRLEEEESDLNHRSASVAKRIRKLTALDLEKSDVA